MSDLEIPFNQDFSIPNAASKLIHLPFPPIIRLINSSGQYVLSYCPTIQCLLTPKEHLLFSSVVFISKNVSFGFTLNSPLLIFQYFSNPKVNNQSTNPYLTCHIFVQCPRIKSARSTSLHYPPHTPFARYLAFILLSWDSSAQKVFFRKGRWISPTKVFFFNASNTATFGHFLPLEKLSLI